MYVEGVLTGGGSVVIDDDLEVNQNLSVTGDILQESMGHGAAKAMVFIDGDLDGCYRSWTYSDGDNSVDCDYFGSGLVRINFPFEINERYWVATPMGSLAADRMVRLQQGSDNIQINVFTSDQNGNQINTDSMLVVY
jgi:hypothetical protein